MDYKKIGQFILTQRKEQNLTQAKLAEKLFVSEKTISKWENGNGLPDTSILPKLCEILNITVAELLNGEKIDKQNYANKADEKLLEFQKIKELGDKRLLLAEIILGTTTMILFILNIFLATYIVEKTNNIALFVVSIVIGFISLIVVCAFCIYIEQKAGYYECKHCGHKHIPSYCQVLWAPHINRTRYMKCPNCKKRSWNKKVLK